MDFPKSMLVMLLYPNGAILEQDKLTFEFDEPAHNGEKIILEKAIQSTKIMKRWRYEGRVELGRPSNPEDKNCIFFPDVE